jgi:hypothetical protein
VRTLGDPAPDGLAHVGAGPGGEDRGSPVVDLETVVVEVRAEEGDEPVIELLESPTLISPLSDSGET